MIPTLTIYITTADLTTLNTIFNGVAMICQQTTFVWGFAMLASMYILLSTSAKTAIAAVSGKAEGVLSSGSFNAIVPFILALLLTSPALKGNVQIQSTVNGRVTVISNVPFIISAIPAAGSILSEDAGGLVETAYQGSGTDYASISASGNGFINPLKVLLASRSAVNRLNGISSTVDSVVTSCLGPDSGVNYATINNMVSNAGNSGATSATSIPINGANPTALGALLYAASLSPGFVPSAGNSAVILSCQDAATAAATDVGTALNSVEFSRVVQGAVNGMDQPHIPANLSLDALTAQWNATRTANLVLGNIAIGANQAQAEVINLLTSELVANELACLSTSGSGRTVCESALIQANEIERHNIQMAAAEVPMLKYAGSFGNLLLALIIGLGPIVVMFMMLSGVNSGKCVKTVAHLIAWPLLTTNVGAELINGMMYINVANFCGSIANGGAYLTQAEAISVYKELSFQIGSASHMMASLPVIMSMIFALGESAALVSVGSRLGPKTDNVGEHSAPTVSRQSAITSQSGISQTTHMPTGAETKINGAMPMINASSAAGKAVARLSSNFQRADSTARTQLEAENVAKDNARVVSNQHFQDWGFTDSEAAAYRAFRSKNEHQSVRDHAGDQTSSSSDNEKMSQAGLSLSGGVSEKGGALGGSASVGTQAIAKAGLHKNINAGHETAVSSAKETGTALENALHWAKTHGVGDRATTEINRRLAAQQMYTESLTTNQTSTSTKGRALEQGNDVTAIAANISDTNIVAAVERNKEYAMYDTVEGQKLSNSAAFNRNFNIAKGEANSAYSTDIIGNEHGREAALRFKAAQMTIEDKHASVNERYEALRFVTGALSHMTHSSFDSQKLEQPQAVTGIPTNLTGRSLPSAIPSNASSPALSATAHAHATHKPAAHHTSNEGQPTGAMRRAVADFEHTFNQPLEPGFDPTGKVKSMDQHAREQGLGAEQEGTSFRVGRIVVGEIKDTFNKKGSQSPVNYGNGGAVEARNAKQDK